MQIQRATPHALDPIQKLLSAVGLPYDDLTPAQLKHFLIGRDGDEICGVVGLEPCGDGALLRSLAVSAAHRNEGLGARLTEAIEQYARWRGIDELYLLTTTASAYFERRGYEAIPRDALPEAIRDTEQAARLCPSDATCMRKRLGASAAETA